MSAVPLPKQDAWRTIIIQLYNNTYALDPYGDRLHSQGYDVINTTNYASALKAAHEFSPALIIVHDDPDKNVDSIHWIELQHTDRVATLAMTPMIILTDAARVPLLHGEELPDRIIVLQRRSETLNQLTRTVKRVLHVWGLDGVLSVPVSNLKP